MIVVFGSINVDLICRVRSHPLPGETILAQSYNQSFGGKGANQAVAAARVLAGSGIPVWMVGAVGRDAFGGECLENLRGNGVDTSLVAAVEAPTGAAFIAVSRDSENTIVVASGANDHTRADQLPHDVLATTSILVMQMETRLAETIEIARRAKRAGVTTLLNLAPFPADATKDELDDLLRQVDVLVVNEHELNSLSGSLALAKGNLVETAVQAVSRVGTSLIATLGAKGAMLVDHTGSSLTVDGFHIDAIDTTGAGDTFVGLLAVGLAEGRDLAASVKRANVAAAIACCQNGAQAGMPRLSEIEAALARDLSK
jgi:ribokinase